MFRVLDVSSLRLLVDVANSSGRNYDYLVELEAQFNTLKDRFKDTSAVDNLQKWNMFFLKKNLYSDIPEVLHLALCCFMKILLEATAMTIIGSVINNHGSENRSSLLPKTLSIKVQVAWNGPSEFSYLTT